MGTPVTVLLAIVLLSGTSFAGYSTGLRRTPKPNKPETVVRPIVYPGPVVNEEDPLWKEKHDHTVEVGKIDGGGVDGLDKTDKIGIDQGKDHPKEDTKVTGSHTGSGHWVPSHDDSPAEEKKVPHGLPEASGKDDIPVKLDDKSVNEEKHPYISDNVPPKDSSIHVGEKQPPIYIPDKVQREDDFPEKIPQLHPDSPKSIEDEKVPSIPHDVPHEKPFHPENGDRSINVPSGSVDGDSKYKDTKVYPEIETDKEDGVAIGPLPYPEFPPRDTAIIPPDFKPGDGDGIAVGPLPHQEIPPRETAIIPPGAKTEVLEPYPMKVGGGNGNINLYELMQKLELSRFLHLVEEADLKDLLTAEGQLTIFAPSDFALSKLDADTIRKLATNKELLRQFVLYHCVDGQIYGPSFEERDNSAMATKFDRSIHINNYGEVWYVNGIPITSRDQTCKNGVIHVLDNCLYPFPSGDLLETLEKLENFKIYTELITNAKLENELKGEAVYTIFAPTDVAFSKLPPANLEWLKWDIPAIKRMFRQLTVSGMYYTPWIPSGNGQLTSIDQKTELSLSGYPDAINVNGVGLTQYDITASNGCIHAIDDIWFLSELGTPSSSTNQKKHD